jgi:tRNA modification GTPase
VLLVIDGGEEVTDEDRELMEELATQPHVIALNKSDLPSFRTNRIGPKAIPVSATTNAGLEDLRSAMLKPFANGSANADQLVITNARHHDLLHRAADEIASSAELLKQHTSEELVLVGLHNALRYLGEILGETTSDDILGQIFATFCIGK